jgi:hypothetical protein
MEKTIIDRIFAEIDHNASRIESLSQLVYTQASSLRFVTKLVLVIITFLIIGGLTVLLDIGKTKTAHVKEKQTIVQTKEVKKEVVR